MRALTRVRVRRKTTLVAGCLLGAALVLSPFAAVAQAVAPEPLPLAQPGRDRPLPEAGSAPSFDFTIEAPRRAPVPRAVEEIAFPVKDIVVTGVTAYGADEFRPLIAALVGKTVHLADIIAVAEKIEARYRGDGYVLSRAYVPAQSVSDGIFHITVVEGYVNAVSVEGGEASDRARIEALLAPVPKSRPLRLDVIEGALLRANDLPGVNVSGLLRPSATVPGASDLVATISAEPVSALLSIDDRGSRLTGLWTVSADVAIRSPLEDGGQILLSASATPEWKERWAVQAKYVEPVGTEGATVSFGGLYSYGAPAGSIADLTLVTNSYAIGPRATYPLVVTRDQKLSLDGGFTWQSADVRALGQPFSHDEWRVIDAALVYQQTGFLAGVTNVTADLAQGLGFLGASPDGDLDVSRPGAVPNFTKVTGLVRRVQPIDGPVSVALVGTGQFAFKPLLIGEEISFGGTQIGRGYDPAALTGDQGAGGDVELRYDLDAPPLGLDQAELYLFYDVAAVWLRTGPLAHNRLQSMGFGGRIAAVKRVSLGLELAQPLNALPTSNDGSRAARVLFTGSVKF
jgi:hemolysin activation/secretion protein